MNRTCAAIVCFSLFTAGFAGHSAERVIKPTQAAMRLKLTYAQGVLEGITLEKFDLVITNAAKLRDMSQTNAFVLLANREYQMYRTNFQASVDTLTVAAKEQDSQKAAEAYMKMAQSCFNCHKTFRREQFVRGQLSNTRFENPNPPERNQP
jgi:siroheme synthase